MRSEDRDLWQCHECGCVNMPTEDVVKLAFAGNRLEPPEYDVLCTECGSDNVSTMVAFLCNGCEEHQVKDDGDYCEECLGEIAEARVEAMREEEWR